jgi:preprotein translocase subunit SecG
MSIVLTVLHVFVCLFLIIVILLQAGRGQGLSWGTFGGTPDSILGTKTVSFLTRLTTGCAIIFLVTCVGLNIIETRKSKSLLAPSRAMSQVDFDKIKEVLDEAATQQALQDELEPVDAAETVQEVADVAKEAVEAIPPPAAE